MTNVETDSIDPAVLAALGREFFKVDKWLDRTGSPAPPPDPNSSLAADDAALDPYQLSHAAWAALSTAVDHMHALRSLIADAHVVHLYAPFTLLRAALENSATAVWLLAHPDPDQRVLRRLRLGWADACDQMKARELMGQPGPRTRQERIARFQGIARDYGLTQEQIEMVTRHRIGFGKIVEEAAEAVPMFFGPKVEATWMVCSGITHGRSWSRLSLLDLTEPRPPVDAVHNLRMTAPDAGLLRITQITTSMIAYGWYLFDKKRKTSRSTI